MRSVWICAAAFAAIVAFSGTSVAAEAKYTCQDGQIIDAHFKTPSSGLGSVALKFTNANQTMDLPQVVSADGGRYSDAHTEFWIKGDGATLTHNGKSTTCETK